jgi:Pentapeptide repeats (8 copies)
MRLKPGGDTMGIQRRSWWQKRPQTPLRLALLVGAGAFAMVLLVAFLGGYFLNWDWTGLGPYSSPPHPKDSDFQRGKTLWDWLQLLVIPVVLAGGGYLFNLTLSRSEQQSAQMHNQTERELALDNQREAAWQAHIDKMSELLLSNHLRASTDEEDEVRQIARIRTLTLLRRLDADRKKSVLQFLTGANLLVKEKLVVGLRYADFNGANLNGIYVVGEDLRFADFIKANLSEGVFKRVDFSEADLSRADLSGATLHAVDLLELISVELT